MFKRREIYIMLGKNAFEGETSYDEWSANCLREGIQSMSQEERDIIDSETGKTVTQVTLVHIRELWHGALRRVIRECHLEDTEQQEAGLKVYAYVDPAK